ncbi:MAG: hypothetical protein JSW73_01965 [Candidatus Woesearchaeota archaeon]|nr:MAG: hypothetical protein JSW73_01965 [Candidatus Woesearchaeota archaeon]
MKIKIKEIKQLCIDVLIKAGASKKDSEIIVNECLYGELIGRKSHGLVYVAKTAEKVNCLKNKWKIEKEDDAYALINAN